MFILNLIFNNIILNIKTQIFLNLKNITFLQRRKNENLLEKNHT